MAYTTIDNPELHFQCKTYTGNGSTQSITLDGSEDMQPDFVWIGNRGRSEDKPIYDSVRGATKAILSNSNAASETKSAGLTSFNSDGFSLGSDSMANYNNDTMVAWCFKAGTSFSNDASATSIGSIDSSGKVNSDSGFSIIGYTGDAQTGTTIAHGLGAKPNFIILKNREPDIANWQVYHSSLAATHYIQLNSTGAAADSNTRWNDTEPTSTVFTTGSSGDVKGDSSGETFIAWCFKPIKGFSKFGSYVGTGAASTAPFRFTGFKPAFLIVKESDGADGWGLYDNKRNDLPGNTTSFLTQAQSSDTESNAVANQIDFLSNGFRVCAAGTNGDFINEDGKTYIYAAFAEAPFVNSNGVPCNAG